MITVEKKSTHEVRDLLRIKNWGGGEKATLLPQYRFAGGSKGRTI